MFDFNTPIDRTGRDSEKWNYYGDRDVLPMWVADMDFAAPPVVLEALRRRIDHGVLGYAEPPASLLETTVEMLRRDHGWEVDPAWLVWTPGLVVALNLVCRSLPEARSGVMTTTPVYPPFLSAPVFTRRKLTSVPLVDDGTGYAFDFDALEAAITPEIGLFILCNPHNPVGRVWPQDDLARIADFCERHDLTLCADEIHCGLLLDDAKQHLSVATLSPEIAERTITLLSASKTFNLAGTMTGFAVVPNEALRRRIKRVARGIVTEINTFGYTACEAAYRSGGPWRDALLDHLRANASRVHEAVSQIEGLSMHRVEATYLAWIDCRQSGIENPVAHLEKHGLGLSEGAYFGAPGFARLNFGCPAATLETGLSRLQQAFA